MGLFNYNNNALQQRIEKSLMDYQRAANEDLYKRIYELNKKVDNLYTKDEYDTLRPKVDIQADERTIDEERLWGEIGKLMGRLDNLEK